MSTLPTPITDQVCEDYKGPLCMIGDVQFIPADFARQLERELTEAKAALTTSTERLTLELREAKAERDALKERAATMSAELDGWESRWANSEVYKKQLAERADALKAAGTKNKYESECFHALCARLWLAVGPDVDKAAGETCDEKLANLLQSARADLSRWRSLAEELAGALKICRNALFIENEWNAGRGEGANHGYAIEPADAALARFRDAANPASGAAITPDIHRTE